MAISWLSDLCDLFEVGWWGCFLYPTSPRKLGWRGVSYVWPLRGQPFLRVLRVLREI